MAGSTGAPPLAGDIDAAQRTEIYLTIDGADVTADVQKRLISATFTDVEDGEPDDFQITLEDSDNAVVKKWLTKEAENRPKTNEAGKGQAYMRPVITQINPKGDGKNLTLACGNFEIDEADMKGPPQQVTMKGTALAYSSGARTGKYHLAWENTTLYNIGRWIAKETGRSYMYLAQKTVKYSRTEMQWETYQAYLQRLCTAANLSLKSTDGTIVIFDQKQYEDATAIRTIGRGDGSYSSYSFAMKLSTKCYVACRVKYTDDDGKEYEGMYVPDWSKYSTNYLAYGYSGPSVTLLQKNLIQLGYDPGSANGYFGNKTYSAVKSFQKDHGLTQDGVCGAKTWEAVWKQTGLILEVTTEPVRSNAEAKTAAQEKLRQANKGEKTGSFTMPGDVTLVAGLTVIVGGFGDYDGKYIIEKGTHTISRSGGYKLKIELREAITGY